MTHARQPAFTAFLQLLSYLLRGTRYGYCYCYLDLIPSLKKNQKKIKKGDQTLLTHGMYRRASATSYLNLLTASRHATFFSPIIFFLSVLLFTLTRPLAVRGGEVLWLRSEVAFQDMERGPAAC